jgi:hypothetical protein
MSARCRPSLSHCGDGNGMEDYRLISIGVILGPHCDCGKSPMPDQKLVVLARDARVRAEEVLVKAETFQNADAKQKMLDLAVKYVEMAERLEQAAAD